MASISPASSRDSGAAESFAALFEESLTRKEMRIGEVITAEVVRVDQNFVVVNAGLKSESFIPIDEFRNDRGDVDVQPGDFVPVAIEALEDGYGETRLSRDKAKRLAAWLDLEKSLESGDTVQGGTKPATINSGAVVQVPFHIKEGDVIKVDTRDARYVEKVNK